MKFNYKKLFLGLLVFCTGLVHRTAASNAVSVAIPCQDDKCESDRYCATDPTLPDNHSQKRLCLPCSLLCLNCGAVHNSTDCGRLCPRFLRAHPELTKDKSTSETSTSRPVTCDHSNNAIVFTVFAMMLASFILIAVAFIIGRRWERRLNAKLILAPAQEEAGHPREEEGHTSSRQEGPLPPNNDPNEDLLKNRS